MPTFRYFVAVGVGTAIALSSIKPGATKDIPSFTQPTSDLAESRNLQPEVVPDQGLLTASTPTVESSASTLSREQPTSAVDHSGVVPFTSSLSEQPQEAVGQAEEDKVGQPVGRSATVEAGTEGISQISNTTTLESVGTDESKPGITPTNVIVEPVADGSNPALTPSDIIIPSASTASGTAHNVLEPTQVDESKSSSPLDGASITQSPAPTNSQPPVKTQETPAPEFLNPSANPLVFPTRTQEVQIQSTQPITLQQALELAHRNNRELQAARLTLEGNQSSLQEALAAEFPTASLTADFTRSDSAQSDLSIQRQADNPLNQFLGTTDDDTISTSFNGTLQLSYDLYTAGRRSASIRSAEERIHLQQLEVERLSEQLRLNVSNGYYALQEADAQVDISQAAVTDAARSLRDAQLLEQAGLGTRFDVLQAQVSLANANQDLTTAISQQRISRRQLVRVLSLAQSVEISAADPIEVAGEWNLSLEQSIVLAYKNRAELEQQLVQRDISEQQRRIALSAIRPQASLNASYNILGVLGDGLGPADGFTLGARLQWNFFDGGAARARARVEQTNIAIAQTRFADQRNQVRLDVEQAFFDLNANAENIQTASFALEQAQESLRLARLRFQAGVGTQADVITQQTELTRARGNRLRAILDYNRALASLQRAVSNLPDSNLFDLP